MDSVILIKIISALVYPVGLFVLAIFFAWVFDWLQKRALSRFCLSFAVTIFVFTSSPVFASWLITKLENQHPQPLIWDIAEHDAIIVLGGGLRRPTLPAKHAQLAGSGDRYWYAVQLYRAGKAKKIIISAGNIIDQQGLESEAYYARELLMQWGVPRAHIIIDEHSRTTAENKQMASQVIVKHQMKSALLVTSAMHMPRAFKLFKSLPIPITPVSTDILVRDSENIDGLRWIPSAAAMQLTTLALHEYYGMFYDDLKALIDKGA